MYSALLSMHLSRSIINAMKIFNYLKRFSAEDVLHRIFSSLVDLLTFISIYTVINSLEGLFNIEFLIPKLIIAILVFTTSIIISTPWFNKKNTQWVRENKISFFIYSFILVGIILITIDIYDGKIASKDFWENVLVEAHGMFLDIVLFGIIFTYYENYHQKNNDIKRYKEEIDDFRGWKQEEAMFRIVGNLHRLIKAGEIGIDLSNCYLIDADLRELNLIAANFSNSILKESKFFSAKLRGSYFNGTLVYNADFSGADLRDCDFSNCYLPDMVLDKDTNVANMKFTNDKTFDNQFFIDRLNLIFGDKIIIENSGREYEVIYP